MTSLLYQAFGIVGYYYLRTVYEGGKVFFGVGQRKHNLRCSACSSKNVKPRGKVKRRFQSLPIGCKKTFVDLEIPRVECRACGLVRQVKVGFADARRTYTRPLESKGNLIVLRFRYHPAWKTKTGLPVHHFSLPEEPLVFIALRTPPKELTLHFVP